MSLPSLFDLSGQRILVTGAASGIGLAISEAMLEAGAEVIMSDLDAELLGVELNRLQPQYSKARGSPRWMSAIPLRWTAWWMRWRRSLAASIACLPMRACAPAGFLVEAGRLENVEMAAWDRVLRVNLDGVLTTMRAASRHMKPRGRGRIVPSPPASTAGACACPKAWNACAAISPWVASRSRRRSRGSRCCWRQRRRAT